MNSTSIPGALERMTLRVNLCGWMSRVYIEVSRFHYACSLQIFTTSMLFKDFLSWFVNTYDVCFRIYTIYTLCAVYIHVGPGHMTRNICCQEIRPDTKELPGKKVPPTCMVSLYAMD